MTEGVFDGKVLIAMVQLEVDVEYWTFLVLHLVPSLLPALHVPPPL